MTITLDQLNDSNMEKNSTSAAGLEEDENGEGIGNTNSDTADLKDVYGYGKPQMMALQKANKLADLIMQEPHRFALHGDPQLASNGLEALKALFDFSLETENLAIPPIAATLHSTFPDDEVADESIKAGSKRKRKDTRKNVNAHHLFEPTPLSELSVEGMSAGQVWDQMELRNAKISTLLDAIIVTDQAEDEDADQEDEDDETDEEEGWGQTADSIGKDELVSKKGNKRAKLGQGEEDEEEIVNNLDKLTDAELRSIGIDPAQRKDFEAAIKEGQLDDSEDEEDSEDDDEHGYPGASDLSDDDELSGVILTEPLLSEAEQQKRKAEIEAREQRQMRSQRQFAKMMKRMQGGSEEDDSEEEEEEEEEEEDGQDEQDEDYNESEEEEEEDDEEEEERRKESILDNLDEKVQFSTATSGKKVKRNAELDDDFFSIEQFNKETDDYGDEGTDLGEDIDLFKSVDQPEDNDDEDEAGQIYYKDFFGPPPFKEESKPSFDESPIKPIEPTEKAPRRIPSVRFNDEVSVLRIKARKEKETQITPELLQMLQQYPDPDSAKAGIESDEETESDEDEEDYDSEEEEEDGDVEEDDMEQDGESEDERDADEEDEVDDDIMEADSNLGEQTNLDQTEKDLELLGTSDSDAEQETAERVAGDLFADEEENSEDDATSGISTHQRRLNALQEEISRLERENVGKKDWTLMGEAGSRARPENSLLEEDVEFESNRKSKPVNTPETTKTIEDLIKNRILENQFDDVQRRATLQPLDFMPSKMLELSDQKSSRSLDQVYEDDFGGVGDSQGQKLDKELQKEHDEIDQLYESLESQLDALSNAHFTPKAPKVSIQTINNAPTISMEESLPTTMSNGTQLAPEEVYAAGSHNEALEGASTELTPEEKRRRHRQLRDEKRAKNERIAEHKRNVEINREAFGQNRGGRFAGKSGSGKQNGKKASEEKEEALRKLMGNKGVSVVGKGDSDSAKKSRTHQSNGHTAPNASNYKL